MNVLPEEEVLLYLLNKSAYGRGTSVGLPPSLKGARIGFLIDQELIGGVIFSKENLTRYFLTTRGVIMAVSLKNLERDLNDTNEDPLP